MPTAPSLSAGNSEWCVGVALTKTPSVANAAQLWGTRDPCGFYTGPPTAPTAKRPPRCAIRSCNAPRPRDRGVPHDWHLRSQQRICCAAPLPTASADTRDSQSSSSSATPPRRDSRPARQRATAGSRRTGRPATKHRGPPLPPRSTSALAGLPQRATCSPWPSSGSILASPCVVLEAG